jgi:hypothetical protein
MITDSLAAAVNISKERMVPSVWLRRDEIDETEIKCVH